MASKELPQAQQLDISDILRKAPDEYELLNLLTDSDDQFYEIGLALKVPHNVLDGLKCRHESNTYKLSQVIRKWITTSESHLVTWETVVIAIEGNIFNNKQKSNDIREYLSSKVKEALQKYVTDMLQCLINPVKVSQLLFSKGYISEITLDKMETLEGTLDEKKTTLLSDLNTAISSSDRENLKELATLLSMWDDLPERIISKYDDEMEAVEKVLATYHSDHQFQAWDSIVGLKSEHTMEDIEYQHSHDMAKLSMMNPRKRLRKDKEISEEELKLKKLRLNVEATSDSNAQASLASDILRCHYGTLAQCLQYPISVAQLLYKEGIISDMLSTIVKSNAESLSSEKALFLLLKAVRHAVGTNYHNLEVFASVLLKQTSNVPCGMTILKDYEKAFPKDTIPKTQLDSIGSNEVSSISTMSPLTNSNLALDQDKTKREVQLPRTMNTQFGSIRLKFAIAFSNIREAIKKSPPPLDILKRFLRDGYSYLKSRIAHSNSIDDVLDVVNDDCTLINISCLESIVKRFDIKEAKTHIQAYKDVIQSFCKEMKASLCLGESFKVTKIPSLLRCETAVFVLDWDPKGCTLEDIKDILAESVEGNVEIRDIREGKSIVVTCFFPFTLTMTLFAKAQETIEVIKKKGLIQLTIGYCTIYDKFQRDKEVRAIIEQNTKELRGQLERQHTLRRKMTIEMSSISKINEEERQKKDKMTEKLTSLDSLLDTKEANEKISVERQKEIETQQEIITSLTLEVRERDEKIKELKENLKHLAFIEKARKPGTDQGLEEAQTKSNKEESTSETIDSKSPLSEQLKEKSSLIPGHDISLSSTGQQQRYQKSSISHDDDQESKDKELVRQATEKELFSVSIEKQTEIEEQQKLLTFSTLQQREKDRENETLKQSLHEMKEKQVEGLTSFPKRKEVIEKELVSVATERQKEIETLQEIITSLTLQLRERDKQIEEIKPNLKGDTGSVQWNYDDNSVCLTRPSVVQSEDVISKLIKEQQTGKEWNIILFSSSPESTAVITSNLNKCTVRSLEIYEDPLNRDIRSVKWWDYDKIVEVTLPTIKESETVINTLKKEGEKGKYWHICLTSSSLESTQLIIENVNEYIVRQLDISYTLLDSKCVSMLSEALKENTSMQKLYIHSSPITDGIKQISDALVSNTTLEVLWLDNVTDITDDDMNQLSNMLTSNKSLKVLRLINCSITDNGVRYICEGLAKNQTLTTLNITGNPLITSVSTRTI